MKAPIYIARLSAAMVLVLSILLLLLLPAHDHDWMRQMNSAIGPDDIHDTSQNTHVVAGLAGIAGEAAASLLMFLARNRSMRIAATGAGILVAVLWWAKFA